MKNIKFDPSFFIPSIKQKIYEISTDNNILYPSNFIASIKQNFSDVPTAHNKRSVLVRNIMKVISELSVPSVHAKDTNSSELSWLLQLPENKDFLDKLNNFLHTEFSKSKLFQCWATENLNDKIKISQRNLIKNRISDYSFKTWSD